MSWTHSNLASVVSVLESGVRPKGGVSTESGEIPSLGGENIISSGGVTLNGLKRVPRKFYERMTKGHLADADILINKDGAQTGKVGLYRNRDRLPSCINEHLFLIRGNANKITQEYLYYTLLSQPCQNQIDTQISGSAQPGLKRNFLRGVFAYIPDAISEQTKIAEILSTVDRAIEQTEALIAKQQRIKTGLMQDLLTRGIDEHGNLRSEDTYQFKDSPIGRVPVDWRVGPISEFSPHDRSYLRTGPFGSDLNTKHWTEEGVPVLTIGSLAEGVVLSKKLLYVTETTARKLNGFMVREGDIVFSRVADIGRSLLVKSHQTGWIISSNLMRISLDQAKARPAFLYRNIAFNEKVRDQLRIRSNSGGRELVNGGILSNLVFPWPQPEEQDRVNERANVFERQIVAIEDRLYKYKKLKIAITHELLTGKRRVTNLITSPKENSA